MDSFYNTVLTVAVILLLLGLTYAGYLLYYYQFGQEMWPKSKGACPDTWIQMGKDADGKQSCIAGYGSRNNNPFAEVDPTKTDYSKFPAGDTGETVYTYTGGKYVFEDLPKCDIKAWADHHKIKWDGITNYNNCLA
jgi:hypothetical protein